MGGSNAFGRGLLAGVLAMLGASAGHWLITPLQHTDAPTWEHALTVVQLIGGFGGALWLAGRERHRAAHPTAAHAAHE